MKISVCIPHYKSGAGIKRCVESVLEQTCFHQIQTEIVVTDDGADDESKQFLVNASKNKYLNWLPNDFRLGLSRNWEKALTHGDGEIVTLLHQDDWYRRNCLETVIETFKEDERISVACFGSFQNGTTPKGHSETEKINGLDFARRLISLQGCPAPSVVFMRRSALLAASKPFYNPKFLFCPELDLLIRICLASPNNLFVLSKHCLVNRTAGELQYSHDIPGQRSHDYLRITTQYGKVLKRTEFEVHMRKRLRYWLIWCFISACRLRRYDQLNLMLSDRQFRRWMGRYGLEAIWEMICQYSSPIVKRFRQFCRRSRISCRNWVRPRYRKLRTVPNRARYLTLRFRQTLRGMAGLSFIVARNKLGLADSNKAVFSHILKGDPGHSKMAKYIIRLLRKGDSDFVAEVTDQLFLSITDPRIRVNFLQMLCKRELRFSVRLLDYFVSKLTTNDLTETIFDLLRHQALDSGPTLSGTTIEQIILIGSPSLAKKKLELFLELCTKASQSRDSKQTQLWAAALFTVLAKLPNELVGGIAQKYIKSVILRISPDFAEQLLSDGVGLVVDGADKKAHSLVMSMVALRFGQFERLDNHQETLQEVSEYICPRQLTWVSLEQTLPMKLRSILLIIATATQEQILPISRNAQKCHLLTTRRDGWESPQNLPRSSTTIEDPSVNFDLTCSTKGRQLFCVLYKHCEEFIKSALKDCKTLKNKVPKVLAAPLATATSDGCWQRFVASYRIKTLVETKNYDAIGLMVPPLDTDPFVDFTTVNFDDNRVFVHSARKPTQAIKHSKSKKNFLNNPAIEGDNAPIGVTENLSGVAKTISCGEPWGVLGWPATSSEFNAGLENLLVKLVTKYRLVIFSVGESNTFLSKIEKRISSQALEKITFVNITRLGSSSCQEPDWMKLGNELGCQFQSSDLYNECDQLFTDVGALGSVKHEGIDYTRIVNPTALRSCSKYFPYLCQLSQVFLRLFQNSPDFLCVAQGRIPEMMLAVECAKQYAISSLDLQLRLFSRGGRYLRPRADYCGVFDSHAQDVLENDFEYPGEQIVRIGNIAQSNPITFENEETKCQDFLAPIILLGCQPFPIQERLEELSCIVRACSRFPNLQLFVKLHPRDSKFTEKAIGDFLEESTLDAWEVFKGKESIGPLIKQASLMITGFSNVVLDAALSKLPVVALNLMRRDFPFPVEELGLGVEVNTSTELLHAMRNILFDPEYREKMDQARENYFLKNSQMRDSDPTQKVFRIIQGMAENRENRTVA